MSNKKRADRGLGYIDRDLYVEGNVHSQKKMVLSGKISGSVIGDQEIVVSETGNVHGKIEANKIIIAGDVNGELLAHKRLEIISSANVKGKMKAPSGQILIKEGANLEAKCKIMQNDEPKKQLTP